MLAGGNINIELADTVPEDTTASDNRWKINADKVKFERSKVAVHLPGDTMSVKVAMDDAVATNYYMDRVGDSTSTIIMTRLPAALTIVIWRSAMSRSRPTPSTSACPR